MCAHAYPILATVRSIGDVSLRCGDLEFACVALASLRAVIDLICSHMIDEQQTELWTPHLLCLLFKLAIKGAMGPARADDAETCSGLTAEAAMALTATLQDSVPVAPALTAVIQIMHVNVDSGTPRDTRPRSGSTTMEGSEEWTLRELKAAMYIAQKLLKRESVALKPFASSGFDECLTKVNALLEAHDMGIDTTTAAAAEGMAKGVVATAKYVLRTMCAAVGPLVLQGMLSRVGLLPEAGALPPATKFFAVIAKHQFPGDQGFDALHPNIHKAFSRASFLFTPGPKIGSLAPTPGVTRPALESTADLKPRRLDMEPSEHASTAQGTGAGSEGLMSPVGIRQARPPSAPASQAPTLPTAGARPPRQEEGSAPTSPHHKTAAGADPSPVLRPEHIATLNSIVEELRKDAATTGTGRITLDTRIRCANMVAQMMQEPPEGEEGEAYPDTVLFEVQGAVAWLPTRHRDKFIKEVVLARGKLGPSAATAGGGSGQPLRAAPRDSVMRVVKSWSGAGDRGQPLGQGAENAQEPGKATATGGSTAV
jgi:hypothetical protein